MQAPHESTLDNETTQQQMHGKRHSKILKSLMQVYHVPIQQCQVASCAFSS